MHRERVRLHARRALGLGLLATCTWIGAAHTAPQSAEPHVFAPATRLTLADAVEQGAGTGALVVDLLDPQEGEPATDEELEDLVRRIDGDPALRMSLAAPYAESDHLYPSRARSPTSRRCAPPSTATRSWRAPSPSCSNIFPRRVPAVTLRPITPRSWTQPRFTGRSHVPGSGIFEAIRVPEAWTVAGEDVVVAVIDTGVAYKDLDHKGVKVRAVPDLAGIEFVDGETFVDKGVPDGLTTTRTAPM